MYFLLACNVGEILIVFGAMLFGMPMSLKPVQLLWLNLVSDGAPALALGLEKGDDDIMKQPARSPKEPVINRDMAIGIGVVGLVDMAAILAVFWLAMQRYPDNLAAAQTMAFVTLCTSELIRAFAARSETHSVFSIGLLSNRWMVAAVTASFVLVLAVVYLPFLSPFFDTVPLTGGDWLLMLPFFFASPLAMELLKIVFRRRGRAAVDCDPEPVTVRDLTIASADQAPLFPLGANAMLKVLVPVHGTHNDEFAIRHVVKQFMNNTAMEVHLLNVQAPFTQDVAHFTSAKSRRDWHEEESAKALAASRAGLEKFGIPYAVHTAVGERAQVITDTARRLHCDQIVMSTSRKNSFTRLVEDSVTNRVLELTAVPVEVIAGDSVSKLEKYGIPAALAAAVAFALAADE